MLFLFAGLALAFLTLRSLDGMAEDNIPAGGSFSCSVRPGCGSCSAP